MSLFFSGKKTIKDVYNEVAENYLADNRPWIIGYSGGKDSTVTAQIVWKSLLKIREEGKPLHKPVYVIASDTLVETPVISKHVDINLELIKIAAEEQGLPIFAHKVLPVVTDTFWVNLIGRGYPAPMIKFRWCTDRLKIRPVNEFIVSKVSEFNEAIIVLGARKSESQTRAQVLSKEERKIQGTQFTRHPTLVGAYVYTPIEDFTADDVWTYLIQVESLWGGDHHRLLTIYKNANAGECPLVIDESTPSCGSTRFGCWVCTVVKQDRSMEAMIDKGQEWMIPLLEYRDMLYGTQAPERKHEFRDYKRRDGRVYFTKDKRIIHGPYKMDFRKEFLRRLLSIEREINRNIKFSMISKDELKEIRRIWITEEQDWEDSVNKIYEQVYEERLIEPTDYEAVFTGDDFLLLDAICEKHDIPTKLVAKLIDIEKEYEGLRRRHQIFKRMESVLSQEWRSKEQILEEMLPERESIDNQ